MQQGSIAQKYHLVHFQMCYFVPKKKCDILHQYVSRSWNWAAFCIFFGFFLYLLKGHVGDALF